MTEMLPSSCPNERGSEGCFDHLDIGHWDLFGIWDLKIGILISSLLYPRRRNPLPQNRLLLNPLPPLLPLPLFSFALF